MILLLPMMLLSDGGVAIDFSMKYEDNATNDAIFNIKGINNYALQHTPVFINQQLPAIQIMYGKDIISDNRGRIPPLKLSVGDWSIFMALGN